MFIEETNMYINERFDSENLHPKNVTYVNCDFKTCFFSFTENVNFSGCNFLYCEFTHEQNKLSFLNSYFYICTISGQFKDLNVHRCFFEEQSCWSAEIDGAEIKNNSFFATFNAKDNKLTNFIFCHNIMERTIQLEIADNKIDKPSSYVGVNTFDNNFLPDGPFIAYKKVFRHSKTVECDDAERQAILTLQIDADTPCVCATGYKGRAAKVKVLKAETLDGKPLEENQIFHSSYSTVYQVGEEVCADKFNPNPLYTCTNGIHFFLNKQDAIDYIL
jgi:hypothetical protein